MVLWDFQPVPSISNFTHCSNCTDFHGIHLSLLEAFLPIQSVHFNPCATLKVTVIHFRRKVCHWNGKNTVFFFFVPLETNCRSTQHLHLAIKPNNIVNATNASSDCKISTLMRQKKLWRNLYLGMLHLHLKDDSGCVRKFMNAAKKKTKTNCLRPRYLILGAFFRPGEFCPKLQPA